jgi:hypothetical protein
MSSNCISLPNLGHTQQSVLLFKLESSDRVVPRDGDGEKKYYPKLLGRLLVEVGRSYLSPKGVYKEFRCKGDSKV